MQGKQLLRSRKNRMIAGVCGGIAEYFNIDATIVRVLWVIFFHVGLLAYLLFWILVPEENP